MKRIREIICKILGHKWHSPYSNQLWICKRCGKANWKMK